MFERCHRRHRESKAWECLTASGEKEKRENEGDRSMACFFFFLHSFHAPPQQRTIAGRASFSLSFSLGNREKTRRERSGWREREISPRKTQGKGVLIAGKKDGGFVGRRQEREKRMKAKSQSRFLLIFSFSLSLSLSLSLSFGPS